MDPFLKPRVRLIATGGTISGGTDRATGERKSLGAEDLIALIPEIEGIAEIEYEDFCRIASSRMTPEIEFSLAKRINYLFNTDPDLSGIVVTHGTDSLEETAFLLWLVVEDSRPVVLTAAQRPPKFIDSDGPRNILSSIRIAVSEKAKNKGVLVCLNDEINSARYVRKTHTIALQTFKSGQYGMIGYVDEDDVLFFNKPVSRINFTSDTIDSKVDLIKLAVGMGSRYVGASIKANVSAIVIESFGRGNIPPVIMEKLLEARKQGIVVVVVTRCDEGRVVSNPMWEKNGIISGEDIDGLKARLLLSLLVTQIKDSKIIQGYFNRLSGKA